jgi:saccharopepsin
MLAPAITLLALSTLISASTIDLPVVIRNTYSSVKFAIGSPPQDHHLLFDTGSASAWIVNTDCTATSCPDGNTDYKRQKYNASASSTAVDLGVDAAIPYLGGDVAGQALQDVFVIPGSGFEWNQTFLSANKSSWRFITADGFLGLGFSSIAVNSTATLVETLLWKGALDAPRFSLFYGTNLDDQGPQDGVLTIGGSHEEKYADGEVVYTPLKKRDEYQLWRAALRSVNVLVAHTPNSTVEIRNGRLPTIALPEGALPKANTTLPVNGSAVFDTGAGRLSVPAEIIGTMYSNLGWNVTKLLNGQERMSCQHLNASWAVTFTLGEGAEEDDVSFTVRGDEFTVPGAQCMPPFDDSGSRGFALVGAAFLRRHYSMFDFGGDKVESYQPRLGFARLKKDYDYLYQ